MPRAGNLRQFIKNVASVVEAHTFDGIHSSRGVNLIGGNRMVVLPLSGIALYRAAQDALPTPLSHLPESSGTESPMSAMAVLVRRDKPA